MDRALQIHVDTEEKYARSMHEEEKEKKEVEKQQSTNTEYRVMMHTVRSQ